MSKKVIIYGSGRSFSSEFFTDRSISHWAVGSLYNELKNNIDLYFCMHQNQDIDFDNKYIINLQNYPLKDIIKKFNSNYFTNSISYMIAYALYFNYDEIYLCGVDMESTSEYEFERASVYYWMGIAKGLGVKMESSSNLDKSYFLYGYDNISKLLEEMEERKKWSINMAEKMEQQGCQKQADQFLGQYTDILYWIKKLKG